MSNWGYEDNDNAGQANTNDGPKALRDAYDAMKAQNKELQDGLAAVQRQLSEQKVAGTLEKLGINPAAAAQYTGEADPAKVQQWATEMQSLFSGGGSVLPNATPNPTSPTEPQVTLEGDAAQQFQRMQEAGQSGVPLGNVEAAYGRIGDATDLQGLIAAWQGIK